MTTARKKIAAEIAKAARRAIELANKKPRAATEAEVRHIAKMFKVPVSKLRPSAKRPRTRGQNKGVNFPNSVLAVP